MSTATKIPFEEVMQGFNEYAEYESPNPLLKKEVPEADVKKLLAAAEFDPDGVVKFALDGIPGALKKILDIPKH
jgi:hypothetical protein